MNIEFFTTGIGALFLVVSLGILLGKVKIAGISLDLSGILFVGLILGHFGVKVPDAFLSFGLVLFVFSVGMQSGPGFFDAFRKNGRSFILMAIMIIALTAVATYLLKLITGSEEALMVGIFNGALTSSPGLAAATEASNSPLVPVAYGVAYPIGIVGVILGVNLIPKLLKIDFKKEEEKYLESIHEEFPQVFGKTFEIVNPNISGKTIGEINIREISNCTASRVLQQGVALTPSVDTIINTGDLIRLVGTEDDLKKAELLFGAPVEKEIPLSGKYDIRWVVVTNKKIINKSYQNVNISAYNSSVVKLRRSGVDITPTPSTIFKFGDKLLLAGTKSGVDRAAELIGDNKKLLSETDLLPIFVGVLAGLFLGKVKIPFFGLFDFTLGNTGGALLAGLLLSKIGKTGPILWTISSSANQMIRKLGLVLFLAVIGTNAGENLLEIIKGNGPILIWMSIIITFIPIILGIILGRFVFKMNFLTILGLVTGIMTSTPGLGAVQSKSDSNAGPVAYATVYPFALVLVILLSQILVKI